MFPPGAVSDVARPRLHIISSCLARSLQPFVNATLPMCMTAWTKCLILMNSAPSPCIVSTTSPIIYSQTMPSYGLWVSLITTSAWSPNYTHLFPLTLLGLRHCENCSCVNWLSPDIPLRFNSQDAFGVMCNDSLLLMTALVSLIILPPFLFCSIYSIFNPKCLFKFYSLCNILYTWCLLPCLHLCFPILVYTYHLLLILLPFLLLYFELTS